MNKLKELKELAEVVQANQYNNWPGSLQRLDWDDSDRRDVQKKDWEFLFSFNPITVLALIQSLEEAERALQKIDEPMKYHHWEDDPYTRAGCFQFVAQEALTALREKWGDK